MTDLMIDEEEMSAVCDGAKAMAKKLLSHAKDLQDTDSDNFTRYMDYMQLKNILILSQEALKLWKMNCISGFDLQHEFFQTKEAKDKGWDKPKIKNNQFFDNEDDHEEIDEGDVMKVLLKMARAARNA